MTEAEYRADPRMNVSLLVRMFESPKHLKWELDHPTPSTAAQQAGTMGHCYILQPAEFNRRYVQVPAFEMDDLNCTDSGKPSTSKATKYCKQRVADFMEKFAGAEIITADDREFCIQTARAVMAEPTAAPWIEKSDSEVVLFGEIEGVACKSRMDLLCRPVAMLTDLKFTKSVVPHRFGSESSKYHMPFRMAFYREMARQNGVPVREVKIIAIENKPPYDVVVYPIREEVLDSKFDDVCRKLREFKHCKATGVWPGSGRGEEQELQIPMWDMNEEDEIVEWSEAS